VALKASTSRGKAADEPDRVGEEELLVPGSTSWRSSGQGGKELVDPRHRNREPVQERGLARFV